MHQWTEKNNFSCYLCLNLKVNKGGKELCYCGKGLYSPVLSIQIKSLCYQLLFLGALAEWELMYLEGVRICYVGLIFSVLC